MHSTLQVGVECILLFNPVSVKFTQATSIKKHCCFNTLRTGDGDLRFYIATVQDG